MSIMWKAFLFHGVLMPLKGFSLNRNSDVFFSLLLPSKISWDFLINIKSIQPIIHHFIYAETGIGLMYWLMIYATIKDPWGKRPQLFKLCHHVWGFIFVDNLITATFNKSDGKRQNALGCLGRYTCNVLRLWNSRDRETV